MNNDPAHLRFASDILRRLGEELIPNPEQGIIELVKNSYDAEAKSCTVELQQVSNRGGTVIIEDRGNGMEEKDLRWGFLVIGRSRKDPTVPTGDLGRLPVGDKGLGRLAALRLGYQVTVRSRPKSMPGREMTLVIDWQKIEAAQFIEDVDLTITEGVSTAPPGVTIEIQNLRKALTKTDVTRLARELLLLSDPFKSGLEFNVKLVTPEFAAQEKLVAESYFDDADFYLTAKVNDDGYGSATLADINGTVIAEAALPLPNKSAYQIPAANFEMWLFRFGSAFTTKSAGLTEVRNWIRSFGGVHIYHRKLRVRPYGDPGSDWLDMNLERVSHPELRPSTNNAIGRVTIEDPELRFSQPTNRIGFVETTEFFELRRFAKDVIRWASDYRLKEALKEREIAKRNAEESSQLALQELFDAVIATVPKSAAKAVASAITKVKKTQKIEVLALRDDLQLYRSLATAGTTAAVFAHESVKPISLLDTISEVIERRGRRAMGEEYNKLLLDPVNQLKDIHRYLNVYSQFPIYHLRKIKRKTGLIKISQVWQSVVDLFQPLLDQSDVEVKLNFNEPDIEVRGSIALFEAIATNLITNSVHALTKEGSRVDDRLVTITCFRMNDDFIQIVHDDNGSGITLPLDDIWLPGKTTNTQGTGFGLTIVRDSVTDLKGQIEALANGDLGGAEFKITLPIFKEKSND
jgi:signal transduction histidine kinase